MLYESEAGGIRLALAGDAMVSQRLTAFREERYLSLISLLRETDAAFCNIEMPIHDFDVAPSLAEGTFGASEPNAARDLRWMGFSLASTANNHIYDFGTEGLLSTQRALKEAGILYAGTGSNLAEARAPAYLDTPKGRVALLAATSTFPEWGRAGDQRPDVRGRPGLSFLRYETTHTVDGRAFQELQRLSAGLGLDRIATAQVEQAIGGRKQAGPSETELYFQPAIKLITGEEFPAVRFVRGDGFATTMAVHEPDVADILRWVSDARRQADWVIFSLHSHEGPLRVAGDDRRLPGPAGVRDVPADFMVDFARRCIDAGVDVFVGHGAHLLRGIEIYKGRPIFYSLAEFVFQNETVRWFPTDSYDRYGLDSRATPSDFSDARTAGGTRGFPAKPGYWRSIVATCQFQSRKLSRVELHPIDLGFGRNRSQRGRPLLADASLAGEVIEDLRRLSQAFGTEIVRDGDHYVIRP